MIRLLLLIPAVVLLYPDILTEDLGIIGVGVPDREGCDLQYDCKFASRHEYSTDIRLGIFGIMLAEDVRTEHHAAPDMLFLLNECPYESADGVRLCAIRPDNSTHSGIENHCTNADGPCHVVALTMPTYHSGDKDELISRVLADDEKYDHSGEYLASRLSELDFEDAGRLTDRQAEKIAGLR